jgi:succinate dehydrogenase / fumarate reductase membrane anchor subunit
MTTHNWQFGRDAASRRTSLGHALGYGKSGHGPREWIIHRLTAVAMILLVPWFLYSLLSGVAVDYASMQAWLGKPGNMLLMILFIVCAFWHGQIAYAVVIHDYVHKPAFTFASLAAVSFGCLALAVFAIIAVLKIGLGG